MDRVIGTVVAAALVLGLVFGASLLRQSSIGGEGKESALAMVAEVEGYSARPEYFQWLVEFAHEEAFEQNYHRERRRRRDTSWLDEEKYFFDLFTIMMRQAGADNVPHVSVALQKYRDQELTNPDSRRSSRPR